MATLQAVIDQIQDEIGALSGIRAAPHEPPESMSAYPFAVAFVKSGNWTLGKPAGCMTGLHDIVVELHIARKDLARDYAAAMAYAKSVAGRRDHDQPRRHWQHRIRVRTNELGGD